MRQATHAELSTALRSRNALHEDGMTDRLISRELGAGVLVKVRRGWYINGALWRQLWDESRHVALLIAVWRDASTSKPVFSHASAAVLWGLPWFGRLEPRAHVVVGDADRSSAPDVFRHEGSLPDEDCYVIHGMHCTALARTLADVARTARSEPGIAVADAAFQLVAGQPRHYDESAAEVWRDELQRRFEVRGGRGIRIARRLIDIADGRADRPGESVSRLQLHRLGFARVRPQVHVPGPTGDYWVDFAIDDAQAFGEFDGKAKYLDEAMRSGLTLEEVLLKEKRREDWIRGTTGRRFVRWESGDISSPARLGARLASFGVMPPR